MNSLKGPDEGGAVSNSSVCRNFVPGQIMILSKMLETLLKHSSKQDQGHKFHCKYFTCLTGMKKWGHELSFMSLLV